MKVQEIETKYGKRYLLLDNEYSVVESVKRYLKYLDSLGRSNNTLKNYSFHLKTYFEYLQLENLEYGSIFDDENRGQIEILSDFLACLRELRNNNTANLIMGTVLSFYDFLFRNGEIKELLVYKISSRLNPYKGFLHELTQRNKTVSILKVPKDEVKIKYIDREEYKLILNELVYARDKVLISLMFEGGLRLSEVLGLHIVDIKMWENKINITPRKNLLNDASVKNKKGGELYLPQYVMKLLSDYILNELDIYESDYLFVNLTGKNKGKPMKHITVEKLFERLSKVINKKVTPHMCRHGHATELHEAGWDSLDIRDRLRHKSISSTIIYVHVTDTYKKKLLSEFYKEKNIEFTEGT